jgi:hypothetical protein
MSKNVPNLRLQFNELAEFPPILRPVEDFFEASRSILIDLLRGKVSSLVRELHKFRHIFRMVKGIDLKDLADPRLPRT